MPVYIWYPLLMGIAIGFSFMNITPIAEQFMSLFGVSYAGLSFFLSGILWSHALSQVPFGLLTDRLGLIRSLLLGNSLGIVANLLPFLAPENLPLAVAARFMLGLCTALGFLGIMKLIGHLAPDGEAAKAQGFSGGSYSLGLMIPYFLLPKLGPGAWVYAYLVDAAIYVTLFICTLAISRVPLAAPVKKLANASPEPVAAPALSKSLAAVILNREIWALGLFHGVAYGSLSNLGQWLPSILADISKHSAGSWAVVTALFLFLGACSRTSSGYVLRLMSKQAAVTCVALALVVLYTLFGLTGNFVMALGLVILLAAFSGLNYGSLFSLTVKAAPAQMVATATGLMNSVANLVFLSLTLLWGNIREITGSFSPALAATGALSLLVWLLFRRTVRNLDERTGEAIRKE